MTILTNKFYYTVIVSIYIAILFLISYYAHLKSNTHDDFLVSGRKNGPLKAAISAGASDMSGWLLLGLPGAVYLSGINQSWIAIGLIIGAYLNWTFVASRLRKFSEKTKTATIPDFFCKHIGEDSQAIRIVCSIMILLFFTIYVSSCFVASAKLFHGYFNISYNWALFLTFIIITTYTAIGGLVAINYHDLLNGLIVIFVIIALPVFVIFYAKDNHISIIQNALLYNKHSLNMFYNSNIIQIISLLAWGLGYFGQPHILNQFMAMKDPKIAKRAKQIGISWMVLGLLFAIIIGFIGSGIFVDNPLKDPETVMIKLSEIFNPVFTSFVLVAILAVTLSTSSSQLIVLSAVFTNDLKLVKKAVILNKIIIFIIGLVALYLASNPNSNVLSIVSYAWAGFGSCFGPLMILSLFFKTKINKNGSLAGILTGGITVIVWNYLYKLNISAIFNIYSILPGFIFSSTSIFIVSYFTKKRSLS